jgi:hypothetical protein
VNYKVLHRIPSQKVVFIIVTTMTASGLSPAYLAALGADAFVTVL